MTDAPARIWATVNGARTRYEIGFAPASSGAYVIGGWQGIPDDSPRATEYVRADIVEAPAPAWRPIETAPKDGTRVLAYRRKVSPRPTDLCRIVWWSGRKWSSHMAGYYLQDADIVGWMPLPPPPQAAGGSDV